MVELKDINKSYHSIIKQWKKITKNDTNNLKWVTENIDKIVKHAEEANKEGTTRAHLNALIIVLKTFKLEKELDPIITRRDELTKKLIDKQKDNNIIYDDWVTHKILLNKLKQLRKQFKRDTSNKELNFKVLLLALYTLQPPLRNNYNDVKIITSKSQETNNKQNYLLLDNNKFTIIINNDKVSNFKDKKGNLTHGQGRINIDSKKLKNIIKTSFTAYPRTYLISKLTNGCEPVSKTGTNKIIRSFFPDKNMNIKILRSSYVSWYYLKQDRTTREREELAKIMRHGATSAQLYYKINKKTIDDKKKELKGRLKPDKQVKKTGKKGAPIKYTTVEEKQKARKKVRDKGNNKYYELNKDKIKLKNSINKILRRLNNQGQDAKIKDDIKTKYEIQYINNKWVSNKL
jgi:hypothetical protein